MMKIIESDIKWTGVLSKRSRTDYIALHHAEASKCTVQDIDLWHKQNGWAGIGYHFFVKKDGTVYRGRPIDSMGAHVSGMNDRSIGICAEGKYTTETMPDVQKKAICELLVYLKDNFYPTASIVGHREIGESDCPGKNYPLDEIKKNYRNIAKQEGLTMTQYEELSARLDKIEKSLEKNSIESFTYNYVDKNMPEWAKEAVQWAVAQGIIKGTGIDEKGGTMLGLTKWKLWVLTVLYRLAKR